MIKSLMRKQKVPANALIRAAFPKSSAGKDEFSREDLEEFVKNLVELYEREKESRCYFQLERDKLMQIREIERGKYAEMRAKLVEMNERLAEMERWHSEEMSNMSRKVRFLIGEREVKLNELKAEIESKKSEELEASVEERNSYLNAIRLNLAKLNEECQNFDEIIKGVKVSYEDRISGLVQEYSEAARNVQKAMLAKLNAERESFALVNKNMAHDLAEMKNVQIEKMNAIKDKAFEELKSFFKELTLSLVDSVRRLEERNAVGGRALKESERKLKSAEKSLRAKELENERLRSECCSLGSTSKLYLTEKRSFQAKLSELEKLRKRCNELELRNEALCDSYENIKLEKDKLYEYLSNAFLVFREKFQSVAFLSNKKFTLFKNEVEKYLKEKETID